MSASSACQMNASLSTGLRFCCRHLCRKKADAISQHLCHKTAFTCCAVARIEALTEKQISLHAGTKTNSGTSSQEALLISCVALLSLWNAVPCCAMFVEIPP